MLPDPLLAFRPEFPILERSTYLVSNSLGAMPRTVADRLAQYVDDWAELGVRAWGQGWWEMPAKVGDEIAPLIGASSGEVVMMPNVTMAQASVLSALDYGTPRNRIVMTALDFPSVRYVYDQLARRLGAEILIVPASADGLGVDTQQLIDAIDARTRLVAISHVLFRSAFVVDVDAVCRKAREVGALVSLDSFHAVGVMHVDVRAIGCHFLTGGVLKWLCGGPGGCFLYVSPDVRQSLAPSLTPVRTSIGDGWALAEDEPALRAPPGPEAPARLLPSGDAYFLLQGADRELLVPDPDRRSQLWTPRVWPGAVLVEGEVVGTWRRAGSAVDVRAWRRLSARERTAVEAEAASLPLSDLARPCDVRWEG